MRYLLLSVLVVCMIGVMIPSAFEQTATGKTQYIDFMDIFLDDFKHTVECGSGGNYYICQGEFWDDDGVRYDLGFRQDLNKEENIFAHISNVSQTEKISELDATCYSGWFMNSLKRLVCVKDNEFSIYLTVLKYHDPIPMMKQILNKIDGKLSLPGTGNSIDPLYLIIGVVAIGGIIGAIAVAKRGSKTPKPAKQELEKYEEKYLAKPKRKPKPTKQKHVEKEETSSTCSNCGNTLNPKAKFCGGCGTKV